MNSKYEIEKTYNVTKSYEEVKESICNKIARIIIRKECEYDSKCI